ncbi:uncharacterized protein LOC144447041 [Glandiceps talaboti]
MVTVIIVVTVRNRNKKKKRAEQIALNDLSNPVRGATSDVGTMLPVQSADNPYDTNVQICVNAGSTSPTESLSFLQHVQPYAEYNFDVDGAEGDKESKENHYVISPSSLRDVQPYAACNFDVDGAKGENQAEENHYATPQEYDRKVYMGIKKK